MHFAEIGICLKIGERFQIIRKIVTDEEKRKNDLSKKDDEIPMEIIKEIAESIDDIVEFSVDWPSNHTNEKIAMEKA